MSRTDLILCIAVSAVVISIWQIAQFLMAGW